MAKVKQIKSMQERLEEAIVPKEQAPFAIPENWCWVKAGYITKILNGYAFKSPQYVSSGIRIIRISNVQDGYIVDEKPVYYSINYINEIKDYLLFEGDLLFSLTGNVGRVALLTANFLPAALNQRVACIRSRNSIVNIKYLFYYFQMPLIFEKFQSEAKGIAQQNLSTESIKNSNIALAPIAEQKRIVDKIESLFSRLDEAKELIQKSLDEFEDRKSAILHKALKGELIKKRSNWHQVRLKDVVYEFQYGTSKKSEKIGKAVVIRMGNLQSGKIDWADLAYSNDEEDIYKYRLEKGDVLFNRTNSAALVGKTSIFEDDRLAIFAGYLIRLKYHKKLVLGKFLNYVMNSQSAKEYCSKVKSDAVNQSNINAKKIAEFSFKLPTIQEQQEIVRILDNFFEKEDKSTELLDMIDQIEEMKKSILARAFRGELGTHSDADEPVIELVRKILLENDMDNNIGLKKKSKRAEEIAMESRTIMEVLSNGNKTTPEKLKEETGLNIDEFYDELKKLVNSNMVKEIREDGEVYLEAINENRSS